MEGRERDDAQQTYMPSLDISNNEEVKENVERPMQETSSFMGNASQEHQQLHLTQPVDEDLSPIVQAVDDVELEKILEEIDSFSFDIFRIRHEDLPKLVERIFRNLDMFKYFPLDVRKLRTFVNIIMGQYHFHVLYHNFRHACDVLHAVYLLLKRVEAEHKLNYLERLALLLSALCHDVDHPGLTNSFLVACNDPLAIRYNDVSVLENHHASLAIKALTGHESTNLLGIFSKPVQRRIRSLLIECILATDMAQHGTILSDLSARLSTGDEFKPSEPFEYHELSTHRGSKMRGSQTITQDTSMQLPDPVTSDDAAMLMRILLKCADISNIWKPFFLSRRWTALLSLEWFRQGDLEKRLGIPVSKYMDRDDQSSFWNMSISCIDYIGKWMFDITADLLPKMRQEIMPYLSANRESWVSYKLSRPLQEEVIEILGPLFPPSERQQRSSISSVPPEAPSESKQLQTPIESQQSQQPNMAQNQLDSNASLKVSPSISARERPLSLLFGAPVVVTQSPETPWNAALRHSSLKFNLRPSTLGSKRSTMESSKVSSNRQEKGSSLLSVSEDDVESLPDKALDHLSAFKPSEGILENLRRHKLAVRLNAAVNSNIWVHFLLVPATMIALFADDFVKAFLPKVFDMPEQIIYIFCIALFSVDLFSLSVLDEEYLLSLSFWLDTVGTLSLIPFILGTIRKNLIVARVWKTAQYLCRSAKKLERSKISNIILVGRVIKLIQHRRNAFTTHKLGVEDKNDEHILRSKPSHIWFKLSELTSQKLILAVLTLTIALPYFYPTPDDLAPVLLLGELDHSRLYTLRFNSSLAKVENFNAEYGYHMVYLGVKMGCKPSTHWPNPDCTGFNDADPYIQVVPSLDQVPDGQLAVREKYRDVEFVTLFSESGRAEAYYSIRELSREAHALSMGLTILTLSVLAMLSFLLSWDTNSLLIEPIERMVQFIQELADNPTAFYSKSKFVPQQYRVGRTGEMMETGVLEGALVKIASLSKVALGDAGMDILSVNLKGTEFNPMVPGKKIRACFGFCDIRNFTDATECLQEDVMMFVNKIADVVHNKVAMHNGFPNKNIGDAFLIVWKKTISDGAQAKGSSFADRALKSFLDVIHALETSDVLTEFAMHPAIQQRMPGYRIHMGFGLHVGWAIEGAIGSSHKVDPSYLSPHVNMASRLEAATKQYGVMILISETVISNLTKNSLRASCRKLDRVTVKGSAEPLSLYTYDLPMFQTDLKVLPEDYKGMFEAAVESYIAGNWHTASEKARDCMQAWPSDKPASVLYNYLKSHNNLVPSHWKGYRELTEK